MLDIKALRALIDGRIFAVVILAIISFVICHEFIVNGISYRYSGKHNLLWYSAFQNELLSGQLLPRYTIPWDGHFGSLAFYFYGSIPFYIAAFVGLLIPGKDLVTEVTAAYYAIHFLSCIAAYFSFRHISHDAKAALLGAILFAVMPFHMAEFLERGGFAAATSFIFAPIALAGLANAARSGRGYWVIGLSIAGMGMCHIPSTLLFLLSLPFFSLFFAREAEKPIRFITRSVGATVLGLGIACLTILPALFLQTEINAQRWEFSEPTDTLFFVDRPWDDLIYGMFAMFRVNLLAFLCLAGALAFIYFWDKVTSSTQVEPSQEAERVRAALPVLIGAVVFYLLMTPISRVFWENVPILPKIQFSWRLLFTTDIFLSVITLLTATVALSYYRSRKSITRFIPLAGVGAALGLNVLGSFYIIDRWSIPEERERWGHVGAPIDFIARDPAEYVPAAVDMGEGTSKGPVFEKWLQAALAAPDVDVLEGSAQTEFESRSGRKFYVAVDAAEPSELRIKRLFLSTWSLKTSDGETLPVSADTTLGFIRVKVPAGQYKLRGTLQKFPIEVVSIFIALICGGLLALSAILQSNGAIVQSIVARFDAMRAKLVALPRRETR